MTNWNGLSIKPSSIPHLLHWDLAYLWALEQAPDQLSLSWASRVAAWKRLLDLFIGGELTVVEGEVPTNLKRLLGGYGLTSVRELRHSGRVVGILSPITIVRPLPDVSATECELIPIPDPAKRDGVIHLLKLLADSLQSVRSGSTPVISALHSIIEDQWIDRQQALATADLSGGITGPSTSVLDTVHTLQLLRSYESVPEIASSNVVAVQANVFDRFGNRFVPTCGQCAKHPALLSARNQEPVVCESDKIHLKCPVCDSLNAVPLENLFISFPSSERTKAIIWTDRVTVGDDPVKSPPPPASRSGNRIEFEWTASESMHADRRFLALQLETPYPIEEASVRSIFYSKFLDCGSAGPSMPLKLEWANWLIGWPTIVRNEPDIVFAGIRVQGLPQEFHKVHAGLSIARASELGVCVFPRQEIEGWSDYRVFLTGELKGWKISRATDDGSRNVSDALIQVPGIPRLVAVENVGRGDTGALWKRNVELIPTGSNTIDIGLDFGTTSTVLAFHATGECHGFLTQGDILQNIDWLAKPQSEKHRGGGILPVGAGDNTLFPSALWVSHSNQCRGIRWSGINTAIPGSEARGDLKWTTGNNDTARLRTEYLTELLFWSIPAILRRSKFYSTPASINLGVAFPLAFSHPQRTSFRDSLKTLQTTSRERFGMALTCYSISESDACVEVIGTIKPKEMFIVADMGGGSLDVAVVKAWDSKLDGNSHLLQIGSVKYGGEICIRHLAGVDDERYWELRDSLARGVPDPAFSTAGAKTLYDMHIPRALELLRIQIESLRTTGVQGHIKVVLVGNGWRLSTLTDLHQDPHSAFCDRYQPLLHAMGCEDVSLWTAPISDGNTKHIVALGSRKNATSGQQKELENATISGKLPSGRTINVAGRKIDWWELVGPGGLVVEGPDGDIKAGISQIEKDYQPTPSKSWRTYLQNAFPQNHANVPTEEALLQKLVQSLSNGRFQVGPLQIILEHFWSRLE